MAKEDRQAEVLAPLVFGIAAAAIAQIPSEKIPSLTGERHENKAYETFQEFYPFYLEEHSDPTCRLLHVLGSTIIAVLLIRDLRHMGVAMAFALASGMQVCQVVQGMERGFVEFAFMGAAYFAVYFLTGGKSVSKAILPILVGYGFAWVGHFVYEHNQPATFTYPSYSLLGDCRMLAEYYQAMYRQATETTVE